MTNLEFYKTKEAIGRAYNEHCNKNKSCEKCRYFTGNGQVDCVLGFALDQHEAPKKRRGYTMKEAEPLLGKKVQYVDSNGATHVELIHALFDKESYVLVNFQEPGFYFERNATVDGKPFGVEVQE